MFLKIDSQNYIIGYAMIGSIDGGIEADDSILHQIDPEKVGYCTYIDGVVTFDQTKYNAAMVQVAKDEIRERRTVECFAIVNRGKPWYDLWTTPQYNQLKDWYTAWLDAPNTGTIPIKPAFLNSDPA